MYICTQISATKRISLKLFTMYEDAFLLMGELAQNAEVIQEIQMSKRGFRVLFVNDPKWLLFPFTKEAFQHFYEYYESLEDQTKK